MRLPSILIFISSFLLTITMAQSVSISRPGCPEKCGSIIIPYPFGIGPECSLNSSFSVTCQNSRLFLSSINLQVQQISLESGIIAVMQPVSPLNCSNELRTQSLGRELIGSPFVISATHNSLAVLGCRNSVWIRANETSTFGGCMAICDQNSTAVCTGVNCCQTTIPAGLQRLQFTYQTIRPVNNNRSCGYAFLADLNWFRDDYWAHNGLRNDLLNPFDQQFVNATMVLEWELDDPELSRHSSCEYRGRSVSSSSYDPDALTTLCYCGSGFEGNPYLPNGCQDIDECSIPPTKCIDATCINELGSYRCENGLSRVKTVLPSIGFGLGGLILLIGAWFSIKAIRRRVKAKRKRNFFKRNGGLLLQQQLSSSSDDGWKETKFFSSKELAQATDQYNENRVLGRGGQGTVYKGMLTDARIVAVKKSKRVDEGELEVFINEVVIMSQINHRNVVKLLGCCLETEVPMVVYEYIPNGTLSQHLHDPDEEFPLSWDMRVRIATEIAGALAYLHSATSTPIYHRDIKSTNILLDDKYKAKISDFGTSKSIAIDQTHLTTRVLGTFGYLDPEYFRSSQFTEKSDVYSFGVVMVELLTGEKAVTSVRAETCRSLAMHFLDSMEENNLFDILDDKVLKEGRKEEIVAIAELARRCLHLNGKRRPTMREVAVELEGIRLKREGSSSQQTYDDSEFHAIEVDEGTYDFSSISESTFMDTNSTFSIDAQHPLL
ncbi:hypothetical protein BUALT_BualtUnG0030400 [Buddleja alternifolia]|uniref:Protein kinase domain-containing protein n=1 Tax=Buddleja alternifolia TaxID=168488 RepID=A0AAV6W3U3_9LAMI|nr:hypothetical protein BUALT_BualtUnG0030400 [Buddleja alternifolia]